MKTTKEIKADYLAFIDGIPDHLETMERLMELSETTYSYEEIDSVRDFYAANFKSPEKKGVSRDELSAAFCAYAGEAFMHHCRGDWDLSKLKSDEAYGSAIILGWGKAGKPHARISPSVWKSQIEKGQLREKLSDAINAAKTRPN